MSALLRRYLLLLALVLPGCGDTESQSYALDETGSSRHVLACDTLIGKVETPVTYTVTRSIEPVPAGGQITYSIVAPVAQVETPVPATFVASDVTFGIPEGLNVIEVEADPPSTPDFTSATAELSGDTVVLRLRGSFPLDETHREVPLLRVTGIVTAPSGSEIVWTTPRQVVGTARVDFFGEQVTTCIFEKPGTIAISRVE